MEAVKEVSMKPGGVASLSAEPNFVKQDRSSVFQACFDHVREGKLLDDCAVARSLLLHGPKNEGDLVAECTAEYRRNVSQLQDLMCNVPRLQDPICKGKLVEACTTEDCSNAADLQGLSYSESDLILKSSNLPSMVERVQQQAPQDCRNACGLQCSTNMPTKEDMVEYAVAEDCNNLWNLQYLMNHLNEQQLVEEWTADPRSKKPSDLHGSGLNKEYKGLCGMVNLHKVKLMEEILRDDSHSRSSFQNAMFDPRKMDSAKERISKDCSSVPDCHRECSFVEEYSSECCGHTLDLPSLLSIMGEMLNAEGHVTEELGDVSGLAKDGLDMEHDGEKKAELHVILQGFKQLPAYMLAEVVMNMSTVAVFLTQHAPSPEENRTDAVRAHVVPAEVDASFSAGNERGTTNLKADTVKANTCLLASTVIPYIKLLGRYYRRSMGSDLRRALHEAKLIEFRSYGPDPVPDWMPRHVSELLCQYGYLGYKEGSFNPLFERIWLPWARSAEFYHDQDVAMICDQETLRRGLHYKTLASLCLSWAIPTRPVLEYMIAKSPQGKIAEIGSGLGYWAALLKKLGADIVAVDDFSEKTIPSALYFPETICIDGEQFVRQGGAHGRALFFCWPQKSWNWKANLGITYKQMYQTCLAEACLDAFHGETVFFVGEKYDGCTFDMAAWMQSSPKQRRTWRLEKEIDIPSWPGVHDTFMCFVRQGEATKHSLGKKKKKAARKAQLVEDAYLSELDKSAKEEDFRKASFAAYPTCSMQ